MAVVNKVGTTHEKCGFVEYKMPKEMASRLLEDRKGNDSKMRPNDYLCKVVNEEFGLKGYCTHVITF